MARKQKMDFCERLLLLEMLMHDIRMWWDMDYKKRLRDKRVWKALELVDEFTMIAGNDKHKNHEVVCKVDWFKLLQAIGVYLAGRHEGRYLKMKVRNGGYVGLVRLHKLKPDFSLRSKEFKDMINEYCKTDFVFKYD